MRVHLAIRVVRRSDFTVGPLAPMIGKIWGRLQPNVRAPIPIDAFLWERAVIDHFQTCGLAETHPVPTLEMDMLHTPLGGHRGSVQVSICDWDFMHRVSLDDAKIGRPNFDGGDHMSFDLEERLSALMECQDSMTLLAPTWLALNSEPGSPCLVPGATDVSRLSRALEAGADLEEAVFNQLDIETLRSRASVTGLRLGDRWARKLPNLAAVVEGALLIRGVAAIRRYEERG